MPKAKDYREVLNICEKLRQKAADLQARYEAMGPEERAAADRLMEEGRPELEFITEIIMKIIDSSMPHAEAERWLGAVERELIARRARQPKVQ